jgi:hypothetical protein
MSTSTRFDVEAHWSAMVATAEATLALGKARDLSLIAHGNSTAAASLHVLYEAANGLVKEMGTVLVQLRHSEDADVRTFVESVLCHLHGRSAVTGQE